MPSTIRPAWRRKLAKAYRLMLWLAFALATTACAAGPSSVPTEAPPVRLTPPPWALQPCKVTTDLDPTVAGLEIRDRARGVDVAECEGKRGLLAQTIDLEHSLQDQQRAAREDRNRPLWKRLTPWRED